MLEAYHQKIDSGDIDIFSFLNDFDDTNNSLFQKHSELISSLKLIQEELLEKDIRLTVFTEFRLEEFSRYLSKKGRQIQKMSLLHLKVYPSPTSVKEWQQKVITYSYFF